MKTTRKILALIITAALCFAMIAPAFADPSYTITIDNAVEGETYTAYKIFNVLYTNEKDPAPSVTGATDVPGDPDGESMHTAYAYTIMDDSQWWPVVTSGTLGQNESIPSPLSSAALGDHFTVNGLTFTKTANLNEWTVQAANGFNAGTFAALLDANKSGKTPACPAVTAGENTFVENSTTDHTGLIGQQDT